MPKQPPLEKKSSFASCHSLSLFIEGNRGKGGFERKRTKYDLGNGGSKMPFCKRYTF